MLSGIFDGKYFLHGQLGKGRGGGVVYRAETVNGQAGKSVAVKYPASQFELEALKAIQERSPGCLGVQSLLSSGTYQGKPYMATGVLGFSLADFFEKLPELGNEEAHWGAVQLVGRMLLRRLEAIHRCGFVHGDVSPGNILFGEALDGGTGLFLVDFGSAQPFPHGTPVMPFWSTVEFNSVSLVDGAVRDPHDDLESLGYVLCHGLYGDLPWFEAVRCGPAWEGEARDEACERARESKKHLLCGTWAALGLEWAHLMHMPRELGKFLLACACRNAKEDGLPDYAAVATFLGSTSSEDDDRALLREVLQHLKLDRGPVLSVTLPGRYAHIAKHMASRPLRAVGPAMP